MTRIFRNLWEVAFLLTLFGVVTTVGYTHAEDRDQKDIRLAETMLLYQRNNGGWPKNYEEDVEITRELRANLLSEKSQVDTTFDNGATHTEMRHLAKVYKNTSDDRYRKAFLQGLDFTLAAQYENGGWPQFYPNRNGYYAHITFNDGAMIGVLRTLRVIALDDDLYDFVDSDRRQLCIQAVERGNRCILECQIEVGGKKTAWCAQHDVETFAPQKARSYELVSISGSESVGIVKYLMEIDPPSPEVIESVQGAITWFDEAKITGIRQDNVRDDSAPGGYDKRVTKDPAAPPLWARFNEIGTNRPIFCSRDGVPRETLAEISHERRNGYSWLGEYASGLLAKDYPAWQRKWAPGNNVLEKK